MREWAYAEGQWAGRRAIISPSLHGKLLTHVEGASFDLQKVHPHYAKVAVSLCAALLSEGLKEELRKEVQGGGGGEREGGGTDMQGEGSCKSIRGVEEPVLSNNYTALSLHCNIKKPDSKLKCGRTELSLKNILVPIHKTDFLQ